MSELENFGKVFSTDVLVLGAGLSGFIAANRIKELNPDLDVLMVDKATAGMSGSKANKGGGVVWVMDKTDDVDKFIDYYCRTTGHFIEDQALLEKFCGRTLDMIGHLERWGIKIVRDEQGNLSRMEGLPLWSLCSFDLDIMLRLRKMALKSNVKLVSKTQAVELLTDGNRVVGAVGFDLLTGEYRIFKAKSVINATGSCDWMVANMWSSGRGDGIAAALRAGAVMRNAEFSNFYNLGIRGNQNCPVGGQYALYNGEGDYISAKYCAELEHDIDIGVILGMEKEVREGRGPVVMEEGELCANNPLVSSMVLFKGDRPYAIKFWSRLTEKDHKYNSDKAYRPEIFPMFIGECAPILTDHDMRSSLDGMWALGDTNHSGCAAFGAVPPPCRLRGTGLSWAGVSALLGEQSIVDYTTQATEPKIDADQVERFKELIYAPMKREHGLSPREPIFALGEAVAPPRFSARKSKDRIEEALRMVRKADDQFKNEVSPAGDWHMLGLCHDLHNMAQCAELYFTAALARTESRGWHYREDFPKRDDLHWRKWVDVRLQGGALVTTTTPMPFESYKVPLQPVTEEFAGIMKEIR